MKCPFYVNVPSMKCLIYDIVISEMSIKWLSTKSPNAIDGAENPGSGKELILNRKKDASSNP